MGTGPFKDNSASGTNEFVETVEEAIKHWTKMWEDDVQYDNAVASNVQVAFITFHIIEYSAPRLESGLQPFKDYCSAIICCVPFEVFKLLSLSPALLLQVCGHVLTVLIEDSSLPVK
jgi:hypothetical protein